MDVGWGKTYSYCGPSSQMKDFLVYLLENIVDQPEKVSVSEDLDASGTYNFQISVDTADMGKVIGKSGRIIRAIRDLVRILAVKQNARVNVTIAEG